MKLKDKTSSWEIMKVKIIVLVYVKLQLKQASQQSQIKLVEN